MRADSAHIAWVPGASAPEQGHPAGRTHRNEQAQPSWVKPLMAEARDAHSIRYGPERLLLRHAAVLVLLTEGPEGPEVLLTERTRDLSDYPSQIVFPGGVAEPGDHGPVATALRVAEEEVGLDINRVTIMDCLPPLALPDTGFIVHPVLAWSEHATFPGSVNYAEVATCLEIPLCHIVDRHWPTPPPDGVTGVAVGPLHLGTLTSAVLDMVLARLLRHKPSRAPGQVNNHTVTVCAVSGAPGDTLDGGSMAPQSSLPGASRQGGVAPR